MDKRRTSTSDSSREIDKTYLERTGVSGQLRDILTKLIENRPEDPLTFLADFFEGQDGVVDRAVKAYQQLCTTHYSKPAFHNNVRNAYDLLSYHKTIVLSSHVGVITQPLSGNLTKKNIIDERKISAAVTVTKQTGKSLKGLTGSNYMELLTLLTNEFPEKVKEQILTKLTIRDHEVVVFDIFKASVLACLVLKDYLAQAESLYKSLDTLKTNSVDKVICEAINQQLSKAVSAQGSSQNGLFEGGDLLGPDKTYSTIATALFNSRGQKVTMTCENFVVGAADAFLSKVNAIR